LTARAARRYGAIMRKKAAPKRGAYGKERERITVRMPVELVDALRKRAQRAGVTLGTEVQRVCADAVGATIEYAGDEGDE